MKPTSKTYLLKNPHLPKQVCKHVSLQGTLHIQTTISGTAGTFMFLQQGPVEEGMLWEAQLL